MMVSRQKASSARLIKAEEERLQSSGGVVDMVIGAITTNMKKQNKAAEKNMTVRETINDIATAKDDAMNVTRSSLHGALHEYKKANKTKVDNSTKDISAEEMKESLEAAAATPLDGAPDVDASQSLHQKSK